MPQDIPSILRGVTRPDLLREECLPDLLAASVARCPQHAALIWQNQIVSYRELDHAARQIGGALAKGGAGRTQVIGLWLPRGVNLLLAQAGISYSGAAWLPFDAETPIERIKTCLRSANASGLVTCREWLPRLTDSSLPVWAVEDLLAGNAALSILNPARPDDPAYVIYTSGSTGEPKGIVITHRSICHFLRSENEILGVREHDRVYQGFSVAFDMSFEEIWISYLVGATLWLAPPSITNDPDALAQALNRERITVLHAVPTLMSLISDPLSGLRLINLGGEACPNALAQRLVRPARKVFNTYGPTETSVSASVAELKLGKPVTIGLPLPNYGLLVVDENQRPLPMGQSGELCIFGPGLAAGYLGRPDLTAARFVSNPLAANASELRMYLTGDLARMDPGGPVHCLGRTDSQVKVRGFRIELDEITAMLNAQPGIATAAVVVRPIAEVDQIVGFVVPVADEQIEPAQLRRALSSRLPPYMVPARFEFAASLPRLTSGKIDLKALRSIPLTGNGSHISESSQPADENEAALAGALKQLFPGQGFDRNADFFADLGGHSLLAARLVSLLRTDSRFATLSVQDIYRERTLGAIAHAMARLPRPEPSAAASYAEAPLLRRFLCGLAQTVIIPCFVLLHMADWLAPFFTYHYFTGDPGDSIPLAVLYSLGVFALARLANFAIAIIGKRFIAGHLAAGRHPLWGVTYFRWWLGQKFCELPDVYLIASTPWLPLYLRALGARIGRQVMIDTITLGAPELLTVDDDASLGTFANIENARVEGGKLVVGPVHVKAGAVIDSYAVLENDTIVGAHSRLCGQSALAAGRTIPDHEVWDGAPAHATGQSMNDLPPAPRIGLIRFWLQAAGFAVTALLVSILFFLPTFPAFILIDWIDAHTVDVFDAELSPPLAFGFFFLLAIPASALLIIVTMLITAALRFALPPQKPGTFSIHGFAFWRKKLMTLILDSSLQVLHGLYASVYAPLWLRLLGVKMGTQAEVSTAAGMSPDLLELGNDSFIADGAMLGDEEQRGGWLILKRTRIGNRSFIGNGAYVPNGSTVPDDVLIGVQTRVPANEQLQPRQTWIGSPPQLLPAREQIAGFPENLTFRPSHRRRLGRGLVEGLRIVLPLALIIATGYLIVVLVMPLAADEGWGTQVALALSLAGCAYGLASFLLVLVLKWLLVGRYRPRAAPMWTPFVWISEAVTNLYESLAVPGFLDILRGTPMLPWALRLMGVRIGCGVFMNTTDITEFDCVKIGDGAELNAWCGPQTHLFEDRVMKIGTVEIGPRVVAGPRTTILYDTRVAENVRLGPLTLVAKGEHLPATTKWEGSPAVVWSSEFGVPPRGSEFRL